MLNEIIIGQKISAGRKANNLSQAQLADMLAVSPQAVSKWERGDALPDIITLEKIAQIFSEDLNYFSENGINNETANENISDSEKEENSVRSLNMSMAVWKDADFSGLVNAKGKFNCSNINNCIFKSADLSETMMKGNNMSDNDFENSVMENMKIGGSDIRNNCFKNCSLKHSVLSGSNITKCDFQGADFTDGLIKGCSLNNLNIENAKFLRTEFRGGSIANVKFNSAFKDCSFIGINFRKTEFENATFTNTFFKNTILKKVKFTNCRADKLTAAFMKASKADISGIEII